MICGGTSICGQVVAVAVAGAGVVGLAVNVSAGVQAVLPRSAAPKTTITNLCKKNFGWAIFLSIESMPHLKIN
jgi:hypothetical protein